MDIGDIIRSGPSDSGPHRDLRDFLGIPTLEGNDRIAVFLRSLVTIARRPGRIHIDSIHHRTNQLGERLAQHALLLIRLRFLFLGKFQNQAQSILA